MKSKLWKVDRRDFFIGLLLSVATAALYEVLKQLNNSGMPPILVAAISAGIAYIIKNFGSDDQGKILGKI